MVLRDSPVLKKSPPGSTIPSSIPHIVVRTQNLIHCYRSKPSLLDGGSTSSHQCVFGWPRLSPINNGHSFKLRVGRTGWSGASGRLFSSNVSWEISPDSTLYSNPSGVTSLIMGDWSPLSHWGTKLEMVCTWHGGCGWEIGGGRGLSPTLAILHSLHSSGEDLTFPQPVYPLSCERRVTVT